MGLEIVDPNTCIRGCCSSKSIPLHLQPSAFTLLSPIARGAESIVYEGRLDGKKVAVKKPTLSTSEELDKFHMELQLLWSVLLSLLSEAFGHQNLTSWPPIDTNGEIHRSYIVPNPRSPFIVKTPTVS